MMPDEAMLRGSYGGESRLARGLWIGRLFVRPSFDDETAVAVDTGRQIDVRKRWCVDLPGLGFSLARARTVDVALQMADEISRNAPDIHEARTARELKACVPAPLVLWLAYVQRMDATYEAPLSFREWRLHASL